jgi:acrylyl-CoA reductase (NADPH)
MTDFRALRVHRNEDRSTRCVSEMITTEALSEGEVEIDVQWSSVNYKDALAVTGKGRIMRRYPCVPGIDLAGVVRSSSDASFKPGDQVLVTGCNIGEALDGGYAERARVPASAVIPMPAGLDPKSAMSLGTAGFTAGLAVLRMLDNHQAPEMGPILVTGATGGVGSIAIDILSGLGFEVIALTGKPHAAQALRELGAADTVAHEDLVSDGKPLESARWGGAVDNLGDRTLAYLTRTVKPFGNIASIGLAQGVALETTVMPFILRGVSLLGIHSVECPRPLREKVWQQLSGDWRPRHLDRIVTRTLTLGEVPDYCEELIAGTVVGRALVRIGAK